MTESTSFYPPLNALLHATSIISRAYSTIIKQPKYAIVKRKQSHKLIKLMIDFRDKIDVSKITIKLKNNLKSKVINNIVFISSMSENLWKTNDQIIIRQFL